MRDFLRQNHVFLSHSLVFLLLLGGLLLAIDKGTLHIALNGFHTPAGDAFFRNFTAIGEWVPYAIAGLLLFWKVGAAAYVVGCNLIAGLVTQILKRIIQAPRPRIFFDLANNPDLFPLVEGVKLHSNNSFPSGHTTTCFAVFFAIAILLSRKDIRISDTTRAMGQYLCFVLAVVGSYSRIYLSQHFAADVFAGACVGLIMTMTLYPLCLRWEKGHPKSFDWHIPLFSRNSSK